MLRRIRPVIHFMFRKGSDNLISARVPVLKFNEAQTGIPIDLNVNNVLGVYNSELLWTYAAFDQRFHILGMCIKRWAKDAGIIGAHEGFFNTYSLILIVLTFLQHSRVLPSLQ